MLSTGFWTPVLVFAALSAIVAVGVYITMLSGQASVGHAAFMGMGAYTAAVLTTNFGIPFLLAILAGVVVGIAAGSLLSLVTMRMSELIVALTTLGFGETMVILAFNWEYIGGANSFSGIPLYTNVWIVLLALVAVVYLAWRLDGSRIGLAARAVRDNRVAAAAMGINVTWVRILTFGLGAGIAAFGGALSAHYTLVVNPDDMSFFRSFAFKIFVLFGGSYTFWGPVIGAISLTVLPEALRAGLSLTEAFSHSLRFIVYGLVIVLVVVLKPNGLIPRVPTGRRRALFGRFAAKLPQPQANVPTTAKTQPPSQPMAEGRLDELVPGGEPRTRDG
ncbi:MAG: branched-chain amino acid ABC transporter permease [Chloroflexi bacterium]|nr:branched-chain amino acid ABC transporter permease [Chloroflexota bacterium]